MGLLDQLWDETLAGPRPESGLSKLRKFNGRQASGKETIIGADRCTMGQMDRGDCSEEVGKVTRSIMIVRPGPLASAGNGGTPPASPAGSASSPLSPLSSFFQGVREGEMNRGRRKSMSDAYQRGKVTGEVDGWRNSSSLE
ncbi:dormancy-associated protein homolog 3-like [Nymphaea colorata]|nr:dormancy-associated protein homolog 3-like [Nymphaea colorata]